MVSFGIICEEGLRKKLPVDVFYEEPARGKRSSLFYLVYCLLNSLSSNLFCIVAVHSPVQSDKRKCLYCISGNFHSFVQCFQFFFSPFSQYIINLVTFSDPDSYRDVADTKTQARIIRCIQCFLYAF